MQKFRCKRCKNFGVKMQKFRCKKCKNLGVKISPFIQCALNQHHANHRHLGAILLRYSRDATKTIDQVAEEIRQEVKANIQEQESNKISYKSVEHQVKRRKVDFTESTASSSASSTIDEKPANSGTWSFFWKEKIFYANITKICYPKIENFVKNLNFC